MKKSFKAQGHRQGDSDRKWKTRATKGMSGHYVQAGAMVTLVKEGESRYSTLQSISVTIISKLPYLDMLAAWFVALPTRMTRHLTGTVMYCSKR